MTYFHQRGVLIQSEVNPGAVTVENVGERRFNKANGL